MALEQFVSLPVTKSQLLNCPSSPLSPQSELVLQASGAVRELLDLKTFVDCFQSLHFNNGSHDSLHLGTDYTKDTAAKLCDEGASMLRKYRRTCTEILGKLQATYQHLLNAEEDKALLFFKEIADGVAIEEVIASTERLRELCENACKVFDEKVRASNSPPAVTELQRIENELNDIIIRYEKDSAELRSIRSKTRDTISRTLNVHDVTNAWTDSTGDVGESVHSAKASAVGNSIERSLAEDKIQDLTESLTSPLAIWKRSQLSYANIHSPSAQVGSDAKNANKARIISLLEKRKGTLKQAREYRDQLETLRETMLDDLCEDRTSAVRILCSLEVILSIIQQATNFWFEASEYYRTSAKICSVPFRSSTTELLSILPVEVRRKNWNSDKFQFKAQALKFIALWTSLSIACDESAQKITASSDALPADKRQRKEVELLETLTEKMTKFVQEVGKEEEQLTKEQEGLINL